MSSVVKIDMPYEILKDAVYFKKKVEDKPDDNENSWRYLRASLLYACMAIEGYLNNFMLNYVNMNKEDMEKEIEKYLTSEISVHTKLTVGLKIITGESMKANSEPYKTFKEINSIRNKLVHYSWDEGKKTYDQLTLNNVDRSIENAKEMIKGIHDLDKSEYPQWVDLLH